MSPRTQAVLAAVMELPEAERAAIAHEILATLHPETPDPADDEFAAELNDRLAEALSDPSATVAWSELRDEA